MSFAGKKDLRDLPYFIHTTLAGGILSHVQGKSTTQGSGTNANNNSNSGTNTSVLFCKAYQKGSCNNGQDHSGLLNGQTKFLRHICAKCWLTNKKFGNYPENSPLCPLVVSTNDGVNPL